jgi:hypothetical protein
VPSDQQERKKPESELGRVPATRSMMSPVRIPARAAGPRWASPTTAMRPSISVA